MSFREKGGTSWPRGQPQGIAPTYEPRGQGIAPTYEPRGQPQGIAPTYEPRGQPQGIAPTYSLKGELQFMRIIYLRPCFLLCVAFLMVGCGLLSEEEPESLPVVEPTLIRNTPTPISLPTLEAKWGQELPVNQYGFSFRPVSIYNVSYQADGVSMVARDAESNIGPRFFLTGGKPEEFESNEKINVLVTFEDGDVVREALATLVDKFVPQLYSVVGHPRPITLNLGSEGLQISGQEVDFSVFGEEPFRGRITILKKTDNQLFIMVGMSPLAQWDYQIEPLHDAILEHLTLFEPVETP